MDEGIALLCHDRVAQGKALVQVQLKIEGREFSAETASDALQLKLLCLSRLRVQDPEPCRVVERSPFDIQFESRVLDSIKPDRKGRGQRLHPDTDGLVANGLILRVPANRIEYSGKIFLCRDQRLVRQLPIDVRRYAELFGQGLEAVQTPLQRRERTGGAFAASRLVERVIGIPTEILLAAAWNHACRIALDRGRSRRQPIRILAVS